MQDPRDVASFLVGGTTTLIGGVSLTQVQSVLGIVATLAGLALTVATFVWRHKEHRHRMRKPSEKERKP